MRAIAVGGILFGVGDTGEDSSTSLLKEYSFTEARQNFASLLDEARQRIK